MNQFLKRLAIAPLIFTLTCVYTLIKVTQAVFIGYGKSLNLNNAIATLIDDIISALLTLIGEKS